jgi:hypothetical protein
MDDGRLLKRHGQITRDDDLPVTVFGKHGTQLAIIGNGLSSMVRFFTTVNGQPPGFISSHPRNPFFSVKSVD